MIFKYFLFTAITFSLLNLSCSETLKKEKLERKIESEVKPDSIITKAESVKNINEPIIPSKSGIVELVPIDGKVKATIHKKENLSVYIKFPSADYSKLSAHIFSDDKKANLRISQIIAPDGKMDGPFGQELNYVLMKKGIYTLRVHENMMAGDTWGGDFTIEITLSK